MASFTVKFPKGSIKAVVEKRLADAIDSAELARVIGEPLAERIKFEAKRGRPMNDEGRFPDLAKLTIENREHLEQYNQTADVYSPPRSNLSFTGQLLDSLKWRRAGKSAGNRAKLSVEVFFSGDRKPYKTGPNSTAKLTRYNRTNQALALTLKQIGFQVFSKAGVERNESLIRRITNNIRSYLRKRLR